MHASSLHNYYVRSDRQVMFVPLTFPTGQSVDVMITGRFEALSIWRTDGPAALTLWTVLHQQQPCPGIAVHQSKHHLEKHSRFMFYCVITLHTEHIPNALQYNHITPVTVPAV